jgi:hypothetical protein
VKNRIFELCEIIKSTIYDTINTAISWGSDMIDNFISGINQKWNDAVNVVSNFAGMIASYIGFSEPEKGPLSKFHTFAPDMMTLFAQGMNESQNIVTNQVQAFSEKIADILQSPIQIDKEISTNINAIDRFNAEKSYADENRIYSGNADFLRYEQSYTVQTMNVNVPGININSDYDMDVLADRLVERLADRLSAKAIRDNRGLGGTGLI